MGVEKYDRNKKITRVLNQVENKLVNENVITFSIRDWKKFVAYSWQSFQ